MVAAAARDVLEDDIPALTRLWHDGWQDAHASILPAEIARQRTFESFGERLRLASGTMRAIGPIGDPDGFSYLKGDELNQFYIHRRARGTGLAARLMMDAERRLADAGVGIAWLVCAIGNDRAARFYEKSGWLRAGVVTIELELPNGICPLDVWRYEKAVR